MSERKLEDGVAVELVVTAPHAFVYGRLKKLDEKITYLPVGKRRKVRNDKQELVEVVDPPRMPEWADWPENAKAAPKPVAGDIRPPDALAASAAYRGDRAPAQSAVPAPAIPELPAASGGAAGEPSTDEPGADDLGG